MIIFHIVHEIADFSHQIDAENVSVTNETVGGVFFIVIYFNWIQHRVYRLAFWIKFFEVYQNIR